MDSLKTPRRVEHTNQPTTDHRFQALAMNRLLVTVIDTTGSQSWCDAVRMPRGLGSKLAGMYALVAHAHDFGRESDDIHLSGEGPG